MIAVYPQLRETKVEFVWGGTLDFTLDVMPHAGKIDGMYFAAGFAGHGVAAATWFGIKLAGSSAASPTTFPSMAYRFAARHSACAAVTRGRSLLPAHGTESSISSPDRSCSCFFFFSSLCALRSLRTLC